MSYDKPMMLSLKFRVIPSTLKISELTLLILTTLLAPGVNNDFKNNTLLEYSHYKPMSLRF